MIDFYEVLSKVECTLQNQCRSKMVDGSSSFLALVINDVIMTSADNII